MLNILQQWAEDHKIQKRSLTDLLERLGVVHRVTHTQEVVGTESTLQNKVRMEEARKGTRLFRNNSGVAYDKTGRPVRFGLANDSLRQNCITKSSDLIGIEPGGRFVSLEIKRPGWVYSGTVDEMAQLNWISFINSMGGRAKFVSSLEDYE